MIPTDQYYQYFSANTTSKTPKSEIYSIKSIGINFLISKILDDTGVLKILKDILGTDRSNLALTIAIYMFSRGNVIEYIDDWCEEFTPGSSVSAQKASFFFSTITNKEKLNFFLSLAKHEYGQ
ncbi:MAG: hypothetical protein LBV23_02155 [Deltaproteobacteria bacterium]|nr:hypothetical protein [Deltaproteobacteria bacterium]